MPPTLPGYRLGDVLGEGGSGTVFAATRLVDDRAVAIKVLRADLALTPHEVKRFLAEAGLLERLAHPGIVPIFAAGQLDDGRPYLVMPRLDGETLSARLSRGPLREADAIAIFDQLVDAIAALHDANVVHRDIKPDNIFIASDDRVVLLDFGIAKDVDGAPSTTTRDGRVRGTPSYMAPERFFHAAASERSDVYELAVTLYEMLAGALPWADVEDVSARLDPARRDLSPVLWTALRAALASNAANRPASVRAFRDAIHATGDANTPPRTATIERRIAPAIAAPTVERPRLRGIGIAVGAAIVASAGVIAFVALRGDAAPPAGSATPSTPTATTFCAAQTPRPVLCADFNGDGDFRAGFVNAGKTPDPGEVGGGTIKHAADGTLVVAAPALVASGNKASAALIAELPTPIRYAIITFRIRIVTELFADDKAVASLFSLDFGPAGAINLSRRQSGTQLLVYQGNTPEKVPLSTPIAVGTWKTVKLIVHNYAKTSDGRGEVFMFVDGLAAKAPLPAALSQAPAPRVVIGIAASRGPAEAFEMTIDDFAITTYDGPEDPALGR